MARTPLLRGGLVAAATLLVAGCGFHLAGSRALPEPLKKVRIDTVLEYEVGEPPLETALRERLQRRGSEITSKSKDGVTVIRLTDLKETRQVLSVGPDGKALEYELITRVTFDARTGTNVWQQSTQIEARQPYSFNAQQVLAKEQEADRLREYLQGELADILLLRLEAAASHPAPPAAPPATPPGVVPPVPAPVPSPPADPSVAPPAGPQTVPSPTPPPAAPPAPDPGPAEPLDPVAPAETPAVPVS